MNSGNLDQRVTLQSRAAGLDALGQANGAWTDVATVWAKVAPLSSREFFAAAQIQQEQTVRITIRQRPGVSQLTRVLWKGVAYDVTSVIQYPRQPFLELRALQGVKDGR